MTLTRNVLAQPLIQVKEVPCSNPWWSLGMAICDHGKTNHIAHKIIFGDMSQNVPGSPILKFSSKHNETLLRTLHTKVHTVEPMSSVATKTLEREQ